MIIEPAANSDIFEISLLEMAIEGRGAAGIETLRVRQVMFPDGFLVARKDGRIIGYLQSCIWDRQVPEFQPRADFFPSQHRLDGAILYLIFVGVSEHQRRHGVGSRLVECLTPLADKYGARKIHAVCRDYLVPFYAGLGFFQSRELPGFLSEGEFFLMERAL